MTNKIAKISNGIFIVATLVLFLLGCHNSFGQQGQKPSSTTIEVSLGEDAVITLEANHTTGFSWQLAKPLEGDLLELSDSKYIPTETGLIGSGGKEVWTFKTLKKGKTEVSLKYVQPWEKDKPPAREATFVIIIK
jgi:inhibitor of cysteine peptidase